MCSDFLSCLNFGQVTQTDRHAKSDAYEPTVQVLTGGLKTEKTDPKGSEIDPNRPTVTLKLAQ